MSLSSILRTRDLWTMKDLIGEIFHDDALNSIEIPRIMVKYELDGVVKRAYDVIIEGVTVLRDVEYLHLIPKTIIFQGKETPIEWCHMNPKWTVIKDEKVQTS